MRSSCVAATAGFWLLVVGVALGWLAAAAGFSDLLPLLKANRPPEPRRGLLHAFLNGSVLLGFTVIAALESAAYPAIAHGPGFLVGESLLLAALLAGNYFGGALIWQQPK